MSGVQEVSASRNENGGGGAASKKKFAPRTWTLRTLAEMTEQQLADTLHDELMRLTPRGRKFALMVGTGSTRDEAAKASRLSTKAGSMCDQMARVRYAVLVLQEQARRDTRINLGTAVEKFQGLFEEARAEKDFGAAARALGEACKLLGLYPEARLRVEHSVNFSEVTPEEWEALALLRHGVRQQVIEGAAVEVKALPAAVEDAEVVP